MDGSAAAWLLRDALDHGWNGDLEGIGGVAEVLDLLCSADVEPPVELTAEDLARVPALAYGATRAQQAQAYRFAQAEALLRIARAEKAHRRTPA